MMKESNQNISHLKFENQHSIKKSYKCYCFAVFLTIYGKFSGKNLVIFFCNKHLILILKTLYLRMYTNARIVKVMYPEKNVDFSIRINFSRRRKTKHQRKVGLDKYICIHIEVFHFNII